jgi:uncharacterized membrane protein
MNWILYFIIYSFIGWMIDSGYRSWYDRKWVSKNALKPLPFSPIYGFGALIVLMLAPFIEPWNLFLEWVVFGVSLALLEGFSGPIVTAVFKKPLWKYHRDKSFAGYTDLWHARFGVSIR